jgi:hypothetical protein
LKRTIEVKLDNLYKVYQQKKQKKKARRMEVGLSLKKSIIKEANESALPALILFPPKGLIFCQVLG